MVTATAPATLDATRTEAAQIDAKIEKLKSDIQEYDATLNLLQVQQRKASVADLPAILRQKEIAEANRDRDCAALVDATNQSATLWGVIRKEEEAARLHARTAEPVRLQSEVLAAVADFKTALSKLGPEANTISNGLRGLRRIIDSTPMGTFPLPPESLAAQAGLRESYEAIRQLQQSFEIAVGIK